MVQKSGLRSKIGTFITEYTRHMALAIDVRQFDRVLPFQVEADPSQPAHPGFLTESLHRELSPSMSASTSNDQTQEL